MKKIAISEFKAHCSALVNLVQRTKQPLCVTRFGQPIVEIRPVTSGRIVEDWPGSMKDKIEILGDIVSPASQSEDWEVLRS